ncbi:MAG: hypothetical protein WC209_08185 [Ignavibacteriaceae bacterium]|jgi:hypothetical protein
MITTRSFTYSLFLYLAFLVHLTYAEQKPITSIGCWQYRWGDSPIDANEKFLWMNDNDHNPSWRYIDKPSDIQIIPGKRDLWIRLRLENHDETNSALFVSRIEKIFEVYIDTNRIYSFGKFTSGKKIPMMGFA